MCLHAMRAASGAVCHTVLHPVMEKGYGNGQLTLLALQQHAGSVKGTVRGAVSCCTQQRLLARLAYTHARLTSVMLILKSN